MNARLYCTLALAGLVLLTLLPGPAGAKRPEGITIKAVVGYDNYIQPSRINPVMVELENTSPSTNLAGDLVLAYNGVEYSTRLELPTPSAKRFFLYFPCDAYPPALTLIIRTKAYTEQFNLSSLYKTVQPADTSILVLTQQSGSLGVINQLPGVRLHRDVYGSLTTQLGSSTTGVYYANLDAIDANPKFFARADMIVLADIDYQQVTPELAETLTACISGGTNVVFSLGLNGPAVAASPLAALCPLKPAATRQIADLGSFGKRYGIKTGKAPATFATGPLAPGAEVREQAGAYPAVVTQKRGSGSVTALAFDVTAVPFKQNAGLAPLFTNTALTVSNSVAVTNWFVHPEEVSDVITKFREGRPMNPSFVLVFLLAYVALVGPANFLVLSRLKRRTLVWTTIPLIILGFSYVGLSTGYLYRGSDNVTAYFQELHVFPNADYTPYQTVMLVFTAERTNYKLEVPDASAFFYPDLPEAIANRFGGSSGRMRGLSGGRIDNSKLPTVTTTQGKWTTKQYYYQGYLNLKAQAAAQLTALRASRGLNQIEGTISLDLPFDLYDCYLYDGTNPMRIGDLPGKGQFTLWQDSPQVGGKLSAENYLAAERSVFSSAQQRDSRLGQRYVDEVLLVGFTEQVEAQAKFDRPHTEHRLTMVVVHLPYQAVIPAQGTPEVVRTLLTSGSGFELDTYDSSYSYNARFGGMESEDIDRLLYHLSPKAYLDVRYEIAGELSGRNHLLLHLNVQDGTNRQPLTDVAAILRVEAWDGAAWRDVPFQQNEMAIDVAVGSIITDERQVNLRFRAEGDLYLQIPWADVY